MKTYEEINKKIENNEAVVLTAEEMIQFVESNGLEVAAKEVDVVTSGTFGAMCSSGAFINFGHSDPPIKMEHLWLNDVHAYHGNAAVDCYIGVTRMAGPRNFEYGGGHVIEELISGKSVHLRATAYGTDCYPRTKLEMNFTIDDLNQAILLNPRNCYQRYSCATNTSDKTIYTYMGKLLPYMGNATYSGAGCLNPLQKDPNYRTIGTGTHISLCGGDGYVVGPGTQHDSKNGVGTIMVTGDMKTMNPKYFKGASFKGYGTTAFIGIGIPIPILDIDMARSAARTDEEIMTIIEDYSTGRRNRPILGQVSYAELKSGKVEINGKEVRVSSISSLKKAREIAKDLKERILKNQFEITKPVKTLPRDSESRPMKVVDVILVCHRMEKAVTVRDDSLVKDVANLIVSKQTDHIVVVDEKEKLKGFLTTFDITKAVAKGCNTISQIMIPKQKVHTVFTNDPIDVAINKMRQFGVSSLPVVDKETCVKGLITAEDIIRGGDQ